MRVPGQKEMTQLRGIVILLVTNIVTFTIILVLLEGSFRLFQLPYRVGFVPTENAVARFDEELGWSYLPNLSKREAFGKQVRDVHFNSLGVRVPGPGVELNARQPSVLFVGGSYTMGHGLAYEETFIAQFAKAIDNQYQMINLGVQAYGTDQAFLTLKKYLSKFKAKVVIYTFIGDHIRRNGNFDRRLLIPYGTFLGTKPRFDLDRKGRLYLAQKPLPYDTYVNSYLIDFIKIHVGKPFNLFPPFPVDVTEALIGAMDDYCRERDVHFLLLNWRWLDRGYNHFEHLKIDVIDLLDGAPPSWDRMRIPGDWRHPSAEASHYVAGRLYQYFAETGLLRLEVDGKSVSP